MNKNGTFLSSMALVLLFGLFAQAQQPYRNPGNGPAVTQVSKTSNWRNPGATFFEEGFESGNFTANGWTLTDADGDGFQWGVSNVYQPHTGSYCAGSSSWTSSAGALNPDNWMATPPIDLGSAAGTVLLDWWVRAQDQVWPSEFYGVYVSTSGTAPADFTGADGAKLFEEKVVKGTDAANQLYVKRTVDLSAYAGEIIYLAFRHFNCTDWFVLDIDDIIVYESSTVDLGITGVVAPSNEQNCQLTSEEMVTVRLFNFGGAPQTGFDVSYTFNGNTVTENFTDVIAPASTFDFTFAQTVDMSELGYYNMSFAVMIDGDVDESNNSFEYPISSTDAAVEVVVNSDSQGGQAWELINSNGDVIANHGAYQWNITESTKVCVIADDCYRFNWYGGAQNTVSVYYNGNLVSSQAATGDFTLFSVGDACEPVNTLFLGHDVQPYGVVGSNYFGGSFLNIGTDNITSFDVQYSVNGTVSAVETITGVSVPQGEVFAFTHPAAYDFPAIGEYQVEVSVSNFNGVFTPETNTFGQTVTILSYRPTTRIFGEEATGTWCGWCVRGHVFMEYMENKYPDTWVGVAVHNQDPMVVTAYDESIANYIGGYPSGLVNRYDFGAGYDVDPSQFEEAYNILIDRVVPADISISAASYNEATRRLTFNVNATFAGNIGRDFNVMAVIIENEVRGTTDGYNQVNYYSGGAVGPMGGYETLADPVPAADMVYQNVARALLGGWDGMAGIVDNPTVDGTNYAHTFNYTIPSTYRRENLVIAAVLIDRNTGEVVNSNKVTFDYAVKTEELIPVADFPVFPNPSNGLYRFGFELDEAQVLDIYVTDFVGRVVSTLATGRSLKSFEGEVDIRGLENGLYFLNVRSGDALSVKKLIKQ